MYEPLVMQLIHWFTNNKKFESQDTVAFLEAILVGHKSFFSFFCNCVTLFLTSIIFYWKSQEHTNRYNSSLFVWKKENSFINLFIFLMTI